MTILPSYSKIFPFPFLALSFLFHVFIFCHQHRQGLHKIILFEEGTFTENGLLLPFHVRGPSGKPLI